VLESGQSATTPQSAREIAGIYAPGGLVADVADILKKGKYALNRCSNQLVTLAMLLSCIQFLSTCMTLYTLSADWKMHGEGYSPATIRSSARIRSHKSPMFMRVRADERCERIFWFQVGVSAVTQNGGCLGSLEVGK
jgi:hypothetical protein